VKALFVVNRRSGARRRDDVVSTIHKLWRWEHDLVECGAPEDLDALISDRFDVIFAVGGDGTVHEVAKRLIAKPIALGIVPTGSGNGLARHIGLPIDVRRALNVCGDGRVETIDTATVNGRPFIGTMGIGFDAWIAEAFATRGARGFRTYFRVALGGIWSYEPQTYELTIDGERRSESALLIAIANASQYGNNARIAPMASLQDGVLDVVIVARRSVRAAARLFSGKLHGAPNVTMLRAKRIDIRRPQADAAHLDGEPVTLPESLTIEIVPRSLRILLPEGVRRI
jgi:YegS/Rv2252/BmrU family lipid kinase